MRPSTQPGPANVLEVAVAVTLWITRYVRGIVGVLPSPPPQPLSGWCKSDMLAHP